ncbi:Guanylate kinase [Blattabacterium sp. (Nauphoeta cinerea)]|uniref:guanylate kinase n=1 Tax=Blattabacterium sp. (Nauphoeta cinerea) TaxID=1316444 RepID=UPI0003B0A35D|nr:guanylate kinase [Blattabacterium sp. (Nauphoeta cinerea)]AGW86058.1 Guanylate kinase [Blattabacterium sp. (Nauphoeta cinerea)]
MKKGKMIILSGPSGSGKTTISHCLLSKFPELKFSVSCTTRSIRNNEIHGKDYYFLSTSSFISKIKKYQFAEWEEVYPKLFYGTLKNEIFKIWKSNQHILFDIDVKGGLNLKRQYPNNSLSIFIMVDSVNILKKRLIARYYKNENNNDINIRLNRAKEENNYAKLFDFVLLNIDLYQTKKKAIKIVSNFIYDK